MRSRFHLGPAAAALALALAGALTAAACGGTQPEQAAEPVVTTNPVDPATAGTIAGRIAFAGTAPAPQPIKTASGPNCQTALTTEALVVDDGGRFPGTRALTILSGEDHIINSLHVVTGGLVLVTSLVLALRAYRVRFGAPRASWRAAA